MMAKRFSRVGLGEAAGRFIHDQPLGEPISARVISTICCSRDGEANDVGFPANVLVMKFRQGPRASAR